MRFRRKFNENLSFPGEQSRMVGKGFLFVDAGGRFIEVSDYYEKLWERGLMVMLK